VVIIFAFLDLEKTISFSDSLLVTVKMNLKNKYRLRVKTCIGTIIDVHRSVNNPYERDDFLKSLT